MKGKEVCHKGIIQRTAPGEATPPHSPFVHLNYCTNHAKNIVRNRRAHIFARESASLPHTASAPRLISSSEAGMSRLAPACLCGKKDG